MYRRNVDQLAPGMVLAKSIYTEQGSVLLREGVPLTDPFIESLKRRGEIAVYVCDGLADDIAPYDIIDEGLRARTVTNLIAVYRSVATLVGGGTEDRAATVDEVIERLGSKPLEMTTVGRGALDELYHDMEELVDEVVNRHTVVSLDSLKNANDYTFQHSVDVAVLGVLLGYRAGLARPELRELALGCLLHDIGKMYIDESMLDKPSALSRGEFEEVKKHPLLGFELVRRMPIATIMPAHVAYQHHERQDGTGYPRELRGSNRIVRTSVEKLDPRRMLLIAECAAVADVHSALSSDRPYRTAMPVDQVAKFLEKIGSRHLNREIVDLFLRNVPLYPIGNWVEVTAGPYRGWRGVVTEVDGRSLHRPEVRLHINPKGEAVADAIEMNLRGDWDSDISCIPPGTTPFDGAVTVTAGSSAAAAV